MPSAARRYPNPRRRVRGRAGPWRRARGPGSRATASTRADPSPRRRRSSGGTAPPGDPGRRPDRPRRRSTARRRGRDGSPCPTGAGAPRRGTARGRPSDRIRPHAPGSRAPPASPSRRGAPRPVLPMSCSSAPSRSASASGTARTANATDGSSPGSSKQPGDAGERRQQVHVDRGPVIGISLGTASDRPPRGHVAFEQADAIEGLERVDRRGAATAGARGTPFGSVGSTAGRRRSTPPTSRRARRPASRARRARSRRTHAGSPRGSASSGAVGEVPRRNRSNTEAVDVLDLARLLEHRTHQPVDRGESGLVREAHRRRDRRLLLRQEPIRTPAASPGAARSRTRVRNSSAPSTERRSASRRMPASSSGRPIAVRSHAERVDVPEPTDALLELGFEQRRDRAEPLTPGVADPPPGVRANARGSPRTGASTAERTSSHPGVGSREDPAVEHRRRRVEPFGRDLGAGLRRSDRVTDAEPGVPQRVQQGLGERRDRRPSTARRAGSAGRGRIRARASRVRTRRARRARRPPACRRRPRARGGTHRRARRGGVPTSGRDGPSSTRDRASGGPRGAGRPARAARSR